MTDALFLHGAALAERIGEVARGAEARCAVAYWGDGAFDTLFADRASGPPPRVVCDLMRGGTNPAEIKRLIAEGAKVRMAPMLHAKIYLSEQGAVIGSANASRNALHGTDPEPLEAGVFVSPTTAAYTEAERHFGALWMAAGPITDRALEIAGVTWRAASRARALAHPKAVLGSRMSLYENLLRRPEVFEGFAVVITTEQSDPEATQQARDALQQSGGAPAPERGYDSFTDWERDEWPELFISVHRGPRGRISVTAQRLIFRYEQDATHRTFLTEVLPMRDSRLVVLRSFTNGSWAGSCIDFPFDSVDEGVYETSEEITELS